MRAPTFLIVSYAELGDPPSKTARARTYQQFLKGGTNHSGAGLLLGSVIREAEHRGQPYRLTAYPGRGYRVTPLPALDARPLPTQHLREVNPGTPNVCWVPCAPDDPDAVLFEAVHRA